MTATDAAPDLEDALGELERGGCGLLVVGSVSDEIHRRTSEGMFGAAANRHRVAIRTDGSCLDPATTEPGDTRLLRWTAAARGQAGTVAPAAGPEPAPGAAATGHDSLRSLTRATFEAVEAAADSGSDSGSGFGDLRLGIDSLVPLLAHREEPSAFRFLHTVLGDVRDAGGMAHAHLPVPADHRSVRTVEPLFDATVELDVDDGIARQRWHVADPAVTSDWLTLDDALPDPE